MKLAKPLTTIAAALAAAGALLVPPPAAAQQKLKVAYVRVTPMLVHQYAEKMGYLKREGLETEIFTLNTGPAVTSAVVSGSADIGFTATVPMVAARAQKQPIKAFIALNYEQHPDPRWVWLVASERSGAKSLSALKGKTVLINGAGTACDLLVRDHLAKAGLTLDSVKIIAIAFPQMQAALELGNADAACTVYPFLTNMQRSEKIKATAIAGGMVANLEQLGRVILDGYFAREDWLPKNEKAAAGFMRAILAANIDLKKDNAKFVELLIEEFKMPKALAEAIPGAFNVTSLVTEAKEFQPLIDALARTQMLGNPITAAELIYPIKP